MVKPNYNEAFDDKGRNIVSLKDWMFGAPVLAKDGNGTASWVSAQASPLFQKGTSGYLIKLNSGDQSGDDWGAGYVPVNQLPTYEFNEAMWSWHQTNVEAYGMNMVIWLHDPTDFDKRVEVTQAPSGVTLENGAGWNAHEFNRDTVQFFFYGENTTGTGLTAGTQYTWKQFQTDDIFKKWVIYRISFEWGWYSTGTFEDAYLADLSLNGQIIVIQPSVRELQLSSNPVPFETRVSKVIDASIGAYAANDMVNDDDCCTSATYWTFTNMAKEKGGYGSIEFANLFNETESQTVNYNLVLYNATPTGNFTDNAENEHPIKADRSKHIGTIIFPASVNAGTLAATTAHASGSDAASGLPISYKCAAGSTSLYGTL
ncbi:hypothetical protein LCGC14_2543140, partial [marine sediment metagenome]